MFAVELCRIIPPLLHIVMYRILYRGGVIKTVLRKEKKSMNESTKTKKALRGSLLALFLCIVLLIGTTFAWFTDTASTGVNKIQAGNLKMKVEYSKDCKTWTEVSSDKPIFDENALWEPGHTEVVYLRVKNAGNLALKYNIATNSYDMERGKNAAGDLFYIDKYLKIGTAQADTAFANREAAIAAIADTEKTIAKETQISKDWTVLKAGEKSAPTAVVLYMPTTVGNEANNVQSWRKPSLKGLGLVVNATQATVESDSFNNTYDENAATTLSTVSYSSGQHNITGKIQANGGFGAVQAEGSAQLTINADVYAVYNNGGAMAVEAGGTSRVIINGGDFRQVGVPKDDLVCDLIYATDSATIEINGGTFKAVTPANTLNVLDNARGKAKIIVNGGRFYKYDPSNPAMGPNEVFLGAGCKVTQDGDWYVVSK